MKLVTEEILDRFKQYLGEEERSRATVEKYLRDMRKFGEYVQSTEERGFDKGLVLEYKQYLNEHYKTTSVNPMLAVINSFFDHIGCLDCKVKLFKIQRIQFSDKKKELTEKNYARLMHTAERQGDIRMSMLLQTIGSTGVRISELRFITIEALETGRADIYNKRKSRIALLPVELAAVLKRYCRKVGIKGGSIFITRSGKLMDRSNISKRMKQLGRDAGVDTAKVFPHNFRHLFARIFYSIERDMVRLMDLLGHPNIATTRIHTIATEEQPRKQISWMKMVLGSF